VGAGCKGFITIRVGGDAHLNELQDRVRARISNAHQRVAPRPQARGHAERLRPGFRLGVMSEYQADPLCRVQTSVCF